MPFLMHICFDNSARLKQDEYIFDYRGAKFKLIQNNSHKWADVLLSILPTYDNNEIDKTYLIATDFLSSFAWQYDSIVKCWYSGGMGKPDSFKLESAKCQVLDFHHAALDGYYLHGNNIYKIADIESEEQRTALCLFRDANNSNNIFLSFLFYWQILEVGSTEAIGWINRTYKKNFNSIKKLRKEDIDSLPLSGQSLGNYFNDDCRNAIAHIKRKKEGKTNIKIDNPTEIKRFHLSNRIIKEFSRTYIKTQLKLNKSLYLVKKNCESHPVFIKEQEYKLNPYPLAYQ